LFEIFVPSVSRWPHLANHFAFRPIGSTTAAIIPLFQKVTTLLARQPYEIVLALDISKAFDKVRYSTLTNKMASRNLPEQVYNRLIDFLQHHTQSVKIRDVSFAQQVINAAQSNALLLDQHSTSLERQT
jgi:hypothetical protein